MRTLTPLAVMAAVLGLPLGAAADQAVFTFPPGGIIRSVTVSDTTACTGQPVLVDVDAQHPTDPAGEVEVYVEGSPGDPQVVQYFGPRPEQKIRLFAITPERIQDRQEVTISVEACPGARLQLLQQRNPFHRYRVDFRVRDRGIKGVREYRWFFGDGEQATTIEPFVSHDYSASMRHPDRYTYFTAFVIETNSNAITGRTIALGSSFALSRSLGFVQADVDISVNNVSDGVAISLVVRNHHGEAIKFNRYLKQYLPCNPTQPPRIADVAAESVFGPGPHVERPEGVKSPGLVTIEGYGEFARRRLDFPLEKVPEETCALGFNLIGESADKKPVYASFYLPVRRNSRFTERVRHGRTLATLKHLVESHLVPNADTITGEDLYLLEQRGFIARSEEGWRRIQ